MKKSYFTAFIVLLGLCTPALAANQYVWLEAESGAAYNPIVVKSDWDASQSIYLASWKFADYSHRSASSGLITFEVYIPESGDYQLWGRTRLPSSGSQPFDISAGNGDVYDNSQWTRWQRDDRSSQAVRSWGWSNSGFSQYFNKGFHTLHLLQREGGPGVHLDKILLTDDASYQPSGMGGAEPVVSVENPYQSDVVERYGQLRLEGSQLTSQSGEAVQLRGISAHGLQWFPLVERQTVPYTAEFFGAEVVRLAMYIEDYSPTDPSDFWGGYMADKEGMLARTEQAIEDAVAAGLYVIVDWHIHNIPSRYTKEAVEFFSHIASKYGHLPNIIYEICNEPVSVSWSGGIKPYAETVISAIRKHDPHNIVIVGTPNWSQDVDAAAQDPLSFDNVMYAFHFYAATHDINTMKNKVEMALNAGLAIFVSEWGSSDVGTSTSNFSVAQQWMEFMNERKLSWVNWSLSNKDESSSVLDPRAPMSGPWSDSDLTKAGEWLKPYFNAPRGGTTNPGQGSVPERSSSSSAASSAGSEEADAAVGDVVIEAERFNYSRDVRLVDNDQAVGYIDQGDYLGYRSVDMDGVSQIVLRIASGRGDGVVEIRVDSPGGTLLATVNVASTGGYSSWQDKVVNLDHTVTGRRDLYIVGRSGQGIMDIDRFTLVKSGSSGASSSSSVSVPAPGASRVILEARHHQFSQGISVVNGNAVGHFDAGDHFGFRDVNMDGVQEVVLRLGSDRSGGVVEIRVDGVNGSLLGTLNVNSTGGYSVYQDRSVVLHRTVTGNRDLYIVGRSGQGILDLTSITLVKSDAENSNASSSSPGVGLDKGLTCQFAESRWPNGFQHGLTVKNNTNSAIRSWQVVVDIGEGASFQHGWSAQFSGNANLITISGASGQQMLQPGQSITLGFQGGYTKDYTRPRCL